MNSRFIYGILSLVLAGIIAFVAIPTIASKTNGVTEIVRVSAPVEKGGLITGESVETVEVGAHNLPDNIARTPDDVVGKYATADLQVGDYFLSSKVSFTPLTSDIQLNNIPSGKVAISVTVKTLASGLSDKLQPEDIIRFYHFLDIAEEVPELQFVKVISVTDAKGLNVDNTKVPDPNSEDEEKQQTATITVLATPQQAQILTEMENNGALHVALVSRGNTELAEELLAQQDESLNPKPEDGMDGDPGDAEAGTESGDAVEAGAADGPIEADAE